MPTISDSVLDSSEMVVTGIYIARGNDTLGPYNSLEAAALVIGGYLRPDDYAARNGDTAWVALSEFLPLSVLTRPPQPAPAPEFAVPTVGTHPHRWRHLAAAFVILLTAPLLAAGGMHWFGQRRAGDRAADLPLTTTEPVLAPAVAAPVAAVLPTPQAPPPAPVADGPLNGSLASSLSGGGPAPLPGVRVAAYPLAALESALDQENAETQVARARLDPQIEVAETERATRAAEAQAALQALRAADPHDPLLASLRFADKGAKTAVKTAEDDYRYLLDERTAAAGGEIYFHGLPEPAVAMDTDAQGCFTLTLPPGEGPYAVAARVRQTADDGTVRLRYWLVRLSAAQRAGREPVRLDDGNVSSSADGASLIHTAD